PRRPPPPRFLPRRAAPFGPPTTSTQPGDDVRLRRNVGVALAERHEGIDHRCVPGGRDLPVGDWLQPVAAECIDGQATLGEQRAELLRPEHAAMTLEHVRL
ncbi:MAG: hypothetical protein ACK559_24575, partial [bacterium]